MFSDASESGLGCCAYLRYELNDGSIGVHLVAAKSRVAPLSINSIVRLELQAAVMSKRLAVTLQDIFRIKIEKIVFIIDSEIVRAMINKESYGFNTFVAVRVGEIQRSTSPLRLTSGTGSIGTLNIADWVSRGKSPAELGPSSPWQMGFDLMYKPVSSWSIKQSSNKTDQLPEIKSYVYHTSIEAVPNISSIIDISRFSTLHRLIKVTARISSLRSVSSNGKHHLSTIANEPNAAAYKVALKMWIHSAQSDHK